jgi:hypothetical protein
VDPGCWLALCGAVLTCHATVPPLAEAVARRHTGDHLLHERGPGNSFAHHVVQHSFVQAQLRQQLLQPRILLHKLLELADLIRLSPAYCFFQR